MFIFPNKISDDPYISLSGIHNGVNFYHTIHYREIVKFSMTEEWLRLLERDLLKIIEADYPMVALIGKNIKSKAILDGLKLFCGESKKY